VALGTISYSVYLLHFACITTLPRVLPPPFDVEPNVVSQLYTACFVLPVLIPIAALSYYVIERPFLALRGRYPRDAPAAARP
jgi:peptidoglycan/LPS O-acetylase OafA/YrhL